MKYKRVLSICFQSVSFLELLSQLQRRRFLRFLNWGACFPDSDVNGEGGAYQR